jgi:hypothetical protein
MPVTPVPCNGLPQRHGLLLLPRLAANPFGSEADTPRRKCSHGGNTSSNIPLGDADGERMTAKCAIPLQAFREEYEREQALERSSALSPATEHQTQGDEADRRRSRRTE